MLKLVSEIHFLTFLLIITCNLEWGKLEKFAGYGQNCDKETKCELNSMLKCKDNTCKCVRPDTMVFINSTLQCYVKSGERCTGKANDKETVPNFKCVPNAVCASDGYCICKYDYMEGEDGVCVSKRFYFQSCEHDKQCREKQRLQCINGKCLCDRTQFLTYNIDEAKCVTMAGYKPIDNSDQSCVPNAVYNYRDKRCKSGFNETADGICVAPYGEQCSPFRTICGRDMICKNGKCECQLSGQLYQDGKCYSKAGQPCVVEVREIHVLEEFWSLKNQTIPCVVNSECKARADNEDIFECQCDWGYVAVNGDCRLERRRWCGSGSSMEEKCDPSRNMECINGICSCPVNKLQYFDNRTETCRGLVGAPCEAYEFSAYEFCTDGSSCVNSNKFKIGRYGNNVCACQPTYRLTKHRKCELISENRTTDSMQK